MNIETLTQTINFDIATECPFVKFTTGGSGVSTPNAKSLDEVVLVGLKALLQATGANHRDKVIEGVASFGGQLFGFVATDCHVPYQSWAGPTVEATATISSTLIY